MPVSQIKNFEFSKSASEHLPTGVLDADTSVESEYREKIPLKPGEGEKE